MTKELYIKDLKDLQKTAKDFLELNKNKKNFAFYGDLGAGKTTLIKALCNELNVVDIVTSPTFSLINEYKCDDLSPVYHMDFYRIKNIDEAYDMGVEDYFYDNSYCLIEWPEKIEDLLPLDIVFVQIFVLDDNTRVLKIS
ncbi:MAG: tRNA (adenosine(37)-N6)-threonylcarbamoyltransferase complex ATPase subunit type 1 TsaE [Bacteroidota bacterium]